ncbi:MAG: hypothetical protein V1787_03150 [Candidatus Micrarchaeota archaeon]
MPNMTLAVPPDLKKDMDKFPVINWSEVARQAFAEKVEELELLKAITARSKLTEKDAIEIGRKIRKGVAKRHGG